LPLRSSEDLKAQIRLRNEVVRLKREMAAISAQDDFARWAKLQRQHDKAFEEHNKKGAPPCQVSHIGVSTKLQSSI
jgi:hypothetical protein